MEDSECLPTPATPLGPGTAVVINSNRHLPRRCWIQGLQPSQCESYRHPLDQGRWVWRRPLSRVTRPRAMPAAGVSGPPPHPAAPAHSWGLRFSRRQRRCPESLRPETSSLRNHSPIPRSSGEQVPSESGVFAVIRSLYLPAPNPDFNSLQAAVQRERELAVVSCPS